MSTANTYKNYSHDWGTPPEWWRWIEGTMGTEGVYDPCPADWTPETHPCGIANAWSKVDPWYVNHPGSRGSAARWWKKMQCELARVGRRHPVIWCLFNDEHWRHLDPSPQRMPGYYIRPVERIGFVWLGPTLFYEDGPKKGQPKRISGERANSPSNWTTWWSSVPPGRPPIRCEYWRTG